LAVLIGTALTVVAVVVMPSHRRSEEAARVAS
jgi:hypothetical protein